MQYSKEVTNDEKWYGQLVDRSPECIIVHRQGKIIFINEACVDLFGVPSKEFLLGYKLIEFIHPDHRHVFKKQFHEMEDPKHHGSFVEFILVRSDGKEVTIEATTIEIMYNGELATQMIMRNISERKLVEQKEAVQDDLGEVVKNLQNLVCRIIKRDDGHFEYTLYEGKMTKKMGLSFESVKGKALHEFLPRREADFLTLKYEQAFKGKVTQFETSHKDHFVFTSLSPIFKGGRVIEVIGSSIDITERVKAEEEADYLAYYDALTNLPNRDLFNDRLRVALRNAKPNKGKVVMMLLDLDRFTKVNDTLGQDSGNQLLKAVASRLRNGIRDGDTVARMGDDEFNILLNHVPDKNAASKIAHNIFKLFESPFVIQGHELYINISMGICIFPNDGHDVTNLIKNAHLAMKIAKSKGRNRFEFYSPTMNVDALDNLSLENSLRKAMKEKQFILHYQPRIDIKTGQLTGMEALIRWEHPTEGLISPVKFIPLAEESGLIIPMTEWVLYTACEQNKKWQLEWNQPLRISVNISAQQFQQPHFEEMVNKILKETGLSPQFLELEITENSLVQNSKSTMTTLHKIKDLGVSISIDDFGTGYSSLSYLKHFPINILKIDRSFISEMNENVHNAAIAKSIITLGQSLQCRVIAEGVETENELTFLLENGCDEVQGFLFSKPMPAEQLNKRNSYYLEEEKD